MALVGMDQALKLLIAKVQKIYRGSLGDLLRMDEYVRDGVAD